MAASFEAALERVGKVLTRFLLLSGDAMRLDTDKSLTVKKKGGGERVIPAGKWWIDRSTPPGDDAIIYEVRPHNGEREISYSSIKANGSTPYVRQ